MSRNEFHAALQHLTDNPQHIVFFEDDLKEYALNQYQDPFFINYWNVNRFISGCYDTAEQQGLFGLTGCIYEENIQ